MIPETRGRKQKHNFSDILKKDSVEFDFSKSARVSALAFAKKNKIKIATRQIDGKLIVYRVRG